jgi:predicted PurR-regulated permease PerM
MVIDLGYWTKVLKKTIIFAISIIVLFLSFRLAVFYTPFLIGFIISLIIEPIIKLIVRKTQMNRKTAAILVLLLIFSILIGSIALGIINIITESSNLLQSLNTHIERMYNQIQEYVNKIEFDRIQIPEQVVVLAETATEDFLVVASGWIANLLTGILQGITSFPIMMIYVVITILSTYFICADKLYILDQLEHHFPRIWVKKFTIHLREIISLLRQLFKSRNDINFNHFYYSFSSLIY